MKFESISLDAFGPFSGLRLDFTRGDHGMWLLYGANEAGKSSSLRAITALLFGVPEQTRDSFIHAGKDLRIGATLSHAGRQIAVLRRKGRKQTLLDPATGEPLPDNSLDDFLAGVDEALWRSLYGLSHETLRKGAEELLRGHGAVGESLFDAGLPASRVRRARLKLQGEAEALFTRKARTRSINQQIAEVERVRPLVAEHSTSATVYLQLEQRLTTLQGEVSALRAERGALQREKSQLEQLLGWLPLIAQRDSFLAERSALGEPREISAESAERSSELQRRISEWELRVAHERQELARVNARLEKCRAQLALSELEVARVEELARRLGEYQKAMLDLPKRLGEQRALNDEQTLLLRRLGYSAESVDIESLRLSRADETKVRRLVREKTQSETRWVECASKLKRAQDSVQRRKRELAALGEAQAFSSLERALMRAQKHVEQDLQLQQTKRRQAELRAQVELLAAELLQRAVSATPGAPARVPSRGLPAEQMDELATELVSLREQHHAQQKALEPVRERWRNGRKLVLQNEVKQLPSAALLQTLRDARDAWLLAVNEQGYSAAWLQELAARLRQADAYSDELFRAAEELSRSARFKEDLDGLESEVKLREEAVNEAEARVTAWHARWVALWRELGVDAQGTSVSVMRSFAQRQREWETARDSFDQEHLTVQRLEASLANVVEELAQELDALGEPTRLLWESLQQFVGRAESVLSALRAAHQARSEAEQRLDGERQQLETLQAEQVELKETERQWRPEWSSVLKQLSLGKDASADQVLETLDGLSELFRRQEEKSNLERRIAGINRDAERFVVELGELWPRVFEGSDEAQKLSVEARAERLVSAVRRATSEQRERSQLEQEVNQRESVLNHAALELEHYRKQLTELIERAGAKDYAELQSLERRAASYRQLSQALAQEERKLIASGDGLALSAIIEKTAGRDAASVRARVLEIQEAWERSEQQIDSRLKEIASGEQQLEQLKEGAARSAEELAARRAELQVSLRKYVRVKLAAEILEREIERYRKDHQAPVLRRGSELFARLTLGAYSGLEVAFDEQDQQILVCRRAGSGREVDVSGLSDGTRDQLYLSLRVASLERSFERGALCPLILDDILIHFDDERVAAALRVLADLGRQTQVLFFTHHARVVEIAREVSGEIGLIELPAARS